MGKSNNINNYTDFFYYAFRNILIISIPLVIISALALATAHSTASNSPDKVSISIPVSCTMSTSGSDSHTTSMVSGQRKENIGTTTINTVCNDKDGYVIYALGTTQNNNNEVVLSSTVGADYDIKTGTAAAGSNTSSWAMKLTAVTGANQMPPDLVNEYTSYTAVPNVWTKVASRSSGTSSLVDSAFTTTYAVYTTPNQPAGTYTGEVGYVMLHPSTTNAPTTTLDRAFAENNKTRLILKTDDTVVEEGSEGSEDIPAAEIVGKYYKMQDMNPGICAATTYVDTAAETQLIDVRDNKTYYATKLRDGHCWMTQNLALDLETISTNVAPLTSDNTDLNDNSLSGAYELGYTYENNVLTWKPARGTNPISGGIQSDTAPDSVKKTDDTTTGHASIGNYYNWTASIASSDSSTLTINTYNDISDNPRNSICPKGWRLPTISSVAANNEFNTLNKLYNGSAATDAGLIAAPLWFVKPGYISGKTLKYYNTTGYYWSSTVGNANGMLAYGLNVGNSGAGTAQDNRYVKRSLRCLAR